MSYPDRASGDQGQERKMSTFQITSSGTETDSADDRTESDYQARKAMTAAQRIGWTDEDYEIAMYQEARHENRLADIKDSEVMTYLNKAPKEDRSGLMAIGLIKM